MPGRKTCYELMDKFYEEAKRKAELEQYERFYHHDDRGTFTGYIRNVEPSAGCGNGELHFRVTEDGELIPRSEAP